MAEGRPAKGSHASKKHKLDTLSSEIFQIDLRIQQFKQQPGQAHHILSLESGGQSHHTEKKIVNTQFQLEDYKKAQCQEELRC